MKNIFFFLGKGGVGKTTLSASLAYYLSKHNKKTYWASIDPAHNICDVIGSPPFLGPKEIEYGLLAEEIDVERYLKQFLKETTAQMKRVYSYFQIINLDEMFEVIKNAPGMEESAMTHALKDIIDRNKDMDYMIIDTPPTGLMLKIFTLPFVTNIWLERIKMWRHKILDKRATIVAIRGKDYLGKGIVTDASKDRVLNEISVQKAAVDFLIKIFTDTQRSCFVLVLNPDRLSLMEGMRIKKALSAMNIHIGLILMNKFGLTPLASTEEFYDMPMKRVPFFKVLDKERLYQLADNWAKDIIKD